MNVLITGGAGFIGSHLVEHIEQQKKDVDITVFDNLSTGKHNVELIKNKGAELFIGSIESLKDINPLYKEQFDIIFHLAAMNRAPRSIKDPVKSNKVNIDGTVYLLELARKHDCPFVFSSSSSVFGHLKVTPRPEKTDTFRPSHPYGLGKLASEHYCRLYNELYGLDTRVIRYFAVYGPRQSPMLTYSAVIPKFLFAAIHDKPITIFGGKQSRNFTFVKDVAEATYLVGFAQKVPHRIYQIGGREEVTINQLANYIEVVTNKKIERIYKEYAKGDIFKAIPEMIHLKEDFGYEPRHSFQEGLTKMYHWYRNHPHFFD
jgi:UDP-glucose 4-epimerase